MKRPGDLSREQLEVIVEQIQGILWRDNRTGDFDPQISWTVATIEYVSGVLEDAGLKPGTVLRASPGRLAMVGQDTPVGRQEASMKQDPEMICRVRLMQTISCQPTDDPSDRVGFIILAGTTGYLRRVARSCHETTNWEGARLVDRESGVGFGHVEFDSALVWHAPEDLPPPDPDDPHPCNFSVCQCDGDTGWYVVNVPLELLVSA
jgi:hypothetical protein